MKKLELNPLNRNITFQFIMQGGKNNC